MKAFEAMDSIMELTDPLTRERLKNWMIDYIETTAIDVWVNPTEGVAATGMIHTHACNKLARSVVMNEELVEYENKPPRSPYCDEGTFRLYSLRVR